MYNFILNMNEHSVNENSDYFVLNLLKIVNLSFYIKEILLIPFKKA